MTGSTAQFEISHLGAQGDGVAQGPDGHVYIPYSLPGEVVLALRKSDKAELVEILSPSVARVEPVCRHFGACGGCKLQHMVGDEYLSLKSEKITKALEKRGIVFELTSIWSAGPGHRRRVVFAASRKKNSLIFGFHRYRSMEIEDLGECPILTPRIDAHLDELRSLVWHFLKRKGTAKITVADCAEGLDVKIEGGRTEVGYEVLERIARDCRLAEVDRLIVDGEMMFQARAPEVLFSGIPVPLPSGAFLQACANAQDHMGSLIKGWLSECRVVADLFAGVGAFSLALAERVRVHAVDNSEPALNALGAGGGRVQGLKPVTVERRDLFDDPLSAAQLSKYDGVVFDPPRAGALAQAQEIAKSDIPYVVAVSCNPNTLARDLRVLMDGGYALVELYGVDQFVYSPHIEVVACLRRA